MALELLPMNYYVVLLAVFVHMILGFLWYSKLFFFNSWSKLSGVKSMNSSAKNMILATLAAFILMFMLGQSFVATNINSLFEALEFGFWIWLGFIATVMLGIVLWEGKSWKLYLINSSFYLISILITSGLFYFFL